MSDWQQAVVITFSRIKIPIVVAAFISTALLSFASGVLLTVHMPMTRTQAIDFFQTVVAFSLASIGTLTFMIAMFFRGKTSAVLVNIAWFIFVLGVILTI